MAQTVGVNREVSVTSGNGGSYPPRTTASANISKTLEQKQHQHQHQHQHQSQPQLSSTTPAARTRPRAKSASNLLTRPSQDVEFHDDTLLDQQDPEGRQDGLAELIDFLRNHAPPSGNFMSIPDDISDEDRGRWYRLRKLGRRRSSRSLSKAPQTIQLPDSAVSGITIGGHRHIAISIPLDASPFGRTPRSQYPVYQHRSVKPLTSRYTPTRAVLNDKGVVTVLRTVTEDRETSSSASPAESQSLASINQQRPQSTTLGRVYSPVAINSGSHGDTSEYFNVYIPATPPRVLSPDQVRQSNEQSREFHDYDQSTSTPISSNRRDNLPSRSISMTGGRFVHPGTSSIDAMMSQPAAATEARPSLLSFNKPHSNGGSQSLSKSIMKTSENDSIVTEAKPVEAKPIAVMESRIRLSSKKAEETPVTVMTTSPLGNPREKPKKQVTKDENSPTPSVKSTQSRRDKVRDKKRKDMEAQRIKRQSQLIVTTEIMPESDQDKTKETPKEEDTEKPPPVPVRSPQRQSICPIMVVANVKPSPPPSSRLPDEVRNKPEPEPEPEPEPKKTTEPSKPLHIAAPKTPSKPVQEDLSSSTTSPPRPYVEGSSNPTPPQSAHGSPAHKKNAHDRTSLSRRREWNAAREQERKQREARAMSPRSKARKLIMSKEETEENKVPTMEKEVLRRYEAYREYRIREMERRVRRLERNGDVWLRALVPVLDNLNRTLANVHEDQQPRRAQGWVSDEELPRQRSPQGRPSRQTSRGRVLTRPGGTSEREFLEQLVRTKEELEAGNVSDDMSGFDTIEPLMRELAGRSRLSFEARSLGMEQDGDGLVHAFSV
ncbi:hypothetical protein N0V84_012665 [Fusarium piperis]|uniref:Uncharacterized protein n=1 Tax=Fusarium piperis TaxID=1435070 RepID=A0A9W8T9U8_9HYPO|nr:hypothetical protein N0V84_012665 [Fusarium piperis]